MRISIKVKFGSEGKGRQDKVEEEQFSSFFVFSVNEIRCVMLM